MGVSAEPKPAFAKPSYSRTARASFVGLSGVDIENQVPRWPAVGRVVGLPCTATCKLVRGCELEPSLLPLLTGTYSTSAWPPLPRLCMLVRMHVPSVAAPQASTWGLWLRTRGVQLARLAATQCSLPQPSQAPPCCGLCDWMQVLHLQQLLLGGSLVLGHLHLPRMHAPLPPAGHACAFSATGVPVYA